MCMIVCRCTWPKNCMHFGVHEKIVSQGQQYKLYEHVLVLKRNSLVTQDANPAEEFLFGGMSTFSNVTGFWKTN